MKNVQKKIYSSLLMIIMLIGIVQNNALSMMLSKSQREAGKKAVTRLKQQIQRQQQYYVYELDDKNKGIWVDKSVVKQCKSIKNMLEDLGEEESEIPLSMPISTIRLVFDVLSNKIDVGTLGMADVIAVANAFNFLDVPVDKMNTVLQSINKEMERDPRQVMELLRDVNPDLQKRLMLKTIVDCLKNGIIETYVNARKKPLAGHPNTVSKVAFSPDGSKIVSGSWGAQNNLILWDITDPNNITHKSLAGHLDDVYSVAFSPDGSKIVSGCWGAQNNLILWDITDPNNITHKSLAGHPGSVLSVAFSPDGSKIVSRCAGAENNLILWTLLTDQEKRMIDHIQNYSTEQLQLLYQWCLMSKKGQTIQLKEGSEESKIFISLSQDMQKLLKDLFLTKKGWYGSLIDWWYKK